MTTTTARSRVEGSQALAPYRDLLLDYDWSNAYEHAAWVATAPETEIIGWAKAIRRDEPANNEGYGTGVDCDGRRY